MSQAGYTPISLYYSTTAAAVPTAGNLASGELAINITDGKLYYKSNAGVVTLIAGATSGPAGGSNTQVQFNSSGLLAGSANFTWNGTVLTAATGANFATTSGSVGIATASPYSPLSIVQTSQGTDPAMGAALLATTSTITGTRLNLNFSMNGVQARARAAIGAVSLNAGGDDCGLAFYTRSAFDGSGLLVTDEKMRIDSSGNVGIGTTSPSTYGKLVVNGAIYSIGGNAVGVGNSDNTNFSYLINSGSTGANNANMTFNMTNKGELMRLTSDGYLGIGTSSPAYTLDVVGRARMGIAGSVPALTLVSGTNGSADVFVSNNTTGLRLVGGTVIGTDSQILLGGSASGTGTNIYFDGAVKTFRNTSGSSEQMVITSAGLVGIGTSSPLDKLHVENGALRISGTTAGAIYLYGAPTVKPYITLNEYGVTNNYIGAGSTTSGVLSINGILASTTGLHVKASTGYVGIGVIPTTLGNLEIQANGTGPALWVQTGGTTSAYTIAEFRTGSNLPALTIYGNGVAEFQGKIGIGTSSPSSPLTVSTTGVNSTVQINSTDGAGGYGAVLSLNNTGTGGREYYISSTSNADGGVGGGKLKFYDVTTATTRMLINSSGNVGIATSSPQGRLNIVCIGSTLGLTGDAGLRIQPSGTGSTDQIVFGYSEAGGYSSGVIGYVATNTGGFQYGALLFATRNVNTNTAPLERMRINPDGAVLVGTTTTASAVSNTALLVAGKHQSFSGSLSSMSSGVAYTMFTMTADFATYIVTVSGLVSAVAYSETAIVMINNTSVSTTVIADGSICTISNSGLNVQYTQSSGVTMADMIWSAVRIL